MGLFVYIIIVKTKKKQENGKFTTPSQQPIYFRFLKFQNYIINKKR